MSITGSVDNWNMSSYFSYDGILDILKSKKLRGSFTTCPKVVELPGKRTTPRLLPFLCAPGNSIIFPGALFADVGRITADPATCFFARDFIGLHCPTTGVAIHLSPPRLDSSSFIIRKSNSFSSSCPFWVTMMAIVPFSLSVAT